MVSAGDRDQLEELLTLAEFSEAFCLMPTNKSTGINKLTMEFYCVFWDVLGSDITTTCAKFLGIWVLTLLCRQTLLPKKGDPHDFRNWFPVLLLSVNYKVVTKAISVQLGSVLVDVILLTRHMLSQTRPSSTTSIWSRTYSILCVGMVCCSPSCPWTWRRHMT
ncbi:unnamed protein product [Caretta caretta]